MQASDPATDHQDTTLVCIARVHDHLRGGPHNFSFDRHYADATPEASTVVRHILQAEQAFLTRSAHFMLSQGIRQFLDLGSGLPTNALTTLSPEATVVHVDTDPAVVAHGRLLCRNHFLQADATHLNEVLVPLITAGTLELHKPIGLLAIGLPHLLPDTARALTFLPSYAKTLAPGSALALTHLTPWFADRLTPAATNLIAGPGNSLHPRRRRKVAKMFTGFDLVTPGLTTLSQPDTALLAGLGVKP
ncbi:SAM-dependent methyltransferase [Lentzea sp. NPDC051838]|uniref:SAM-dependent methyltransferase n=1 Tax=Lentzea sp. NPDC051838 TaxID=3154849 RepID=UPI003443E736